MEKFNPSKEADQITKIIFEDPDLTFEQSLNRMLNIASQIPKITIIKGTASIPDEQPYFIKDPINGKNIAIFDSTGQYQSLENTDAFVLITQSRLIIRESNSREKVTYISSLKEDESVKEDDINQIFDVIAQIPLIKINNGIANIEESQPYIIKNNSADNIVAVIDTTGEYKEIKNDDSFLLLLTADSLHYRNPLTNKTDSVILKDIDSQLIFENLESVFTYIKSFMSWKLPLIVAPFFLAFAFGVTILIILLYSVITTIFVNILKVKNLETEDNIRLTSFALTPVIWMNFFVPHLINNQGLVLFLISVGYIFFAVKSVAEINNIPPNTRENDA
ncbi:DUF1189 domain-containing protein [Rickettsiales bacterium]|nr:DUF1189 domain-containing protein [Rickettsiales bacterium]